MKRLLNDIELARQAREYVSPEEQAKYTAEEEFWSDVSDNLHIAVHEANQVLDTSQLPYRFVFQSMGSSGGLSIVDGDRYELDGRLSLTEHNGGFRLHFDYGLTAELKRKQLEVEATKPAIDDLLADLMRDALPPYYKP